MKARSFIKRRTRPKAVNRKRKASNFVRAYGSRLRVEWVKGLPCVVPSAIHGGEIENAHTQNGGAGRKADARYVVPMCRDHHRYLHQHGQEAFQATFVVNLNAAARRTEIAWQAHSA